jgi:hypothetical protein
MHAHKNRRLPLVRQFMQDEKDAEMKQEKHAEKQKYGTAESILFICFNFFFVLCVYAMIFY